MKDWELRKLNRQNKKLASNLKQTQRTLKQTQKAIKNMPSPTGEAQEKKHGIMSKLLFGKGIERPEFDPSTISTDHIIDPKTMQANSAVMEGQGQGEEVIPSETFDTELMFAATKNAQNPSKLPPRFIADSFYYVEDFNGLKRWQKEAKNILADAIKPIPVIAFNAKENIAELLEFTKQGHAFGAIGYTAKNTNIPLPEVNNNLTETLNNNENIIAIAGAGLDKNFSASTINQQIELLKLQIEIAQDFNIPIIIEQKNAETELLKIINNQEILGIYTGDISSPKLIEELLNTNFYIAITATENHKNIVKIPTEKLLIASGNIASPKGWVYPSMWEETFNNICQAKNLTTKADKNTLIHQLNQNFITAFFGAGEPTKA